MQDVADLNQPLEDVVQPSFLNREWDDLERHRLKPVWCAILRRKAISGQLRDNGPQVVAARNHHKASGRGVCCGGRVRCPGSSPSFPSRRASHERTHPGPTARPRFGGSSN
jgi:hypothetical protein